MVTLLVIMYLKFQRQFPHFKELSLSNFYRNINHVHSSYIRIYGDEVTYPLRIILRFELKKQLIKGIIKVSDVLQLWNAKMEQFLGITPKDDSEECLQDIHWSSVFLVIFQLMQFLEIDKWHKYAKVAQLEYRLIAASRGDNYALDGALLATSFPFYRVALDPVVASDRSIQSSIF